MTIGPEAMLLLERTRHLLGNDRHADLPIGDLFGIAQRLELIGNDDGAEVDECGRLTITDPDVHIQGVLFGPDMGVFDCVVGALLAMVEGRFRNHLAQVQQLLGAGVPPLGLRLQLLQQVLELCRAGRGRSRGLEAAGRGLLGELLFVLGDFPVLHLEFEGLVFDPLLEDWDLFDLLIESVDMRIELLPLLLPLVLGLRLL